MCNILLHIMIKLAIFLDGVLYDSKEYHFNALNNAICRSNSLNTCYFLLNHLAIFDGMPDKLKNLRYLLNYRSPIKISLLMLTLDEQTFKYKYLFRHDENHFKSNLIKKSNIILVLCKHYSIESTVKKSQNNYVF